MKVYQCAVMGSGGVGKSAITVRFINGSYLEWYDPTIEDSYRKQFLVDLQPCLLEILDTAGIDQYLTLNDLFIRESEGFILVFSIASRDTFTDVIRLREDIMRIKDPPPEYTIPIVLVGNKADLHHDRAIEIAEAEKMAAMWDGTYFETSARSNTNILGVFEQVVRQMRLSDRERPQRIQRRKSRKKCVIL